MSISTATSSTGFGVRNSAYKKLHRHLIPDRWDKESVAELTRRLESYASKHGRFQLQAILTGGQYDHPDGIFYGGNGPTEAHLRFLKIIDNHVTGAEQLMYLDWHTGLGPYGSAELIGATRPGTPHGDRVQAWFANNLTSTTNGTSSSAPVTGTVGSGLRARLKDTGAEITSLTVEFGTYPPEEVLMAIIADNWLHQKGDPDSEVGRGIKARLRHALYPDEDDWKELVWVRGKQLIHRAIRGLADL